MRHPQRLVSAFPDGVCRVICRIRITWYPLRALATVLPAPPHLQVRQYRSVFWVGENEVSLFGSILHSWGNQALAHAHFHGRNHMSLAGSFLALSCTTLKERWQGDVKLFLLPSSMHPILTCFCSNSMLELLCLTPRYPPKALVSLGDWQNQCSLRKRW